MSNHQRLVRIRITAMLFAASGLAVTGGLAAAARSVVSPTRSPQSGMGATVAAVTRQVLVTYPDAYLVEIDARAKRQSRTAHSLNDWTFIFNEVEAKTRVIFAKVRLPNLETTVTVAGGDLFDRGTALDPPYRMGLIDADVLLRRAGVIAKYQDATYRQPNSGGFYPHPLWIFGPFEDQTFVAIDSATSQVFPLSPDAPS